MINEKMFELAERLRSLREEKAETEQKVKDLNAEIDDTEYALTEIMAETETQNFTRGGKQFILTTTTRWSAETDRKDELYSALREQGYEHLFTVNHQTLGSFVKEQVADTLDDKGETHVPEWLEGMVKSYDKTGVTIKNSKK